MAETLLATDTIVTVDGSNSPNLIEIWTLYIENEDCDGNLTNLPNTLEAIISLVPGVKNNISHLEGELLITMKNYPLNIDFWIDDQGHLIVKGFDCDRYSIDNNGHLIYDFCP